MKYYLKEIGLAMCLTCFPFAVGYADKLDIPGGDTVNLGESTELWDTGDSVSGKLATKEIDQLKVTGEWKKIIQQVISENIQKNPKEAEQLLEDSMKTVHLYQIRSKKDNTFHQGFIVTFSLPGKYADTRKKLFIDNGLGVKLKKTDNPVGEFMKGKELVFAEGGKNKKDVLPHQVKVYLRKEKKEVIKNKGNGHHYQTKSVQMGIQNDFLFLPLFVETIEFRGEKSRGYAILMTNQASGKYFYQLLKESLKGNKNEDHA